MNKGKFCSRHRQLEDHEKRKDHDLVLYKDYHKIKDNPNYQNSFARIDNLHICDSLKPAQSSVLFVCLIVAVLISRDISIFSIFHILCALGKGLKFIDPKFNFQFADYKHHA
jgi:hypothetical protein